MPTRSPKSRVALVEPSLNFPSLELSLSPFSPPNSPPPSPLPWSAENLPEKAEGPGTLSYLRGRENEALCSEKKTANQNSQILFAPDHERQRSRIFGISNVMVQRAVLFHHRKFAGAEPFSWRPLRAKESDSLPFREALTGSSWVAKRLRPPSSPHHHLSLAFAPAPEDLLWCLSSHMSLTIALLNATTSPLYTYVHQR